MEENTDDRKRKIQIYDLSDDEKKDEERKRKRRERNKRHRENKKNKLAIPDNEEEREAEKRKNREKTQRYREKKKNSGIPTVSITSDYLRQKNAEKCKRYRDKQRMLQLQTKKLYNSQNDLYDAQIASPEKKPNACRQKEICQRRTQELSEIKLRDLQTFDEKESISGVQQLKSSVQKGIRARLLELYPHLENHIDQVLPKKDTFRIVKCHDHVEIMVNSAGELLFFRHREGPWIPTLRLLHKYPFFLPMQQVDKGAIRFVLSGANIMCPGLTSPGARMSSVDKGSVVAVMAEGKQHALAVGMTSLSTDDIAKVNKGVGIENCHYLNDGLWQMKPVK